jgi:DNA-binding NarL/FixJ family response regulator
MLPPASQSRGENSHRNIARPTKSLNKVPLQEIRVLIADDHPVARQGLSSILKSLTGVQVVGEAADGNEACELYDQLSPDVISVYHRMPAKFVIKEFDELMSSLTPNPRYNLIKTNNSE